MRAHKPSWILASLYWGTDTCARVLMVLNVTHGLEAPSMGSGSGGGGLSPPAPPSSLKCSPHSSEAQGHADQLPDKPGLLRGVTPL